LDPRKKLLKLFCGCQNLYQTSHMISPPMPALRADDPVIKPFGVDTLEIPMPPTTWRMSVLPT
jgi:hypothetical protein